MPAVFKALRSLPHILRPPSPLPQPPPDHPLTAWGPPSSAAARPKKVCMPVAYTTQWRSPCLMVEPAGRRWGQQEQGSRRAVSSRRGREHVIGGGTCACPGSLPSLQTTQRSQALRSSCPSALLTREGDVAAKLLDGQGLAGEGGLVALQHRTGERKRTGAGQAGGKKILVVRECWAC